MDPPGWGGRLKVSDKSQKNLFILEQLMKGKEHTAERDAEPKRGRRGRREKRSSAGGLTNLITV